MLGLFQKPCVHGPYNTTIEAEGLPLDEWSNPSLQ